MKHYVNQNLREEIVKMMVSLSVVELFKDDEAKYQQMFGKKHWGYMKQGYALMLKGLSEGLSPTIGQEESAKIRHLTKKFKIVLMRRTEPLPKDTTPISTPALYDLAEKAIGNTCAGCTITDYKACELYQVLDNIDMPISCMTDGQCPFLQ